MRGQFKEMSQEGIILNQSSVIVGGGHTVAVIDNENRVVVVIDL